MPKRSSLCTYQQTTLPLVEMRQNRLELRRQNSPCLVHPAHARPTNHRAKSHELKICTPLTGLWNQRWLSSHPFDI
ncbi:hypothetical protein [Streptomyces sp. NBC_01594]|uniref:hypothetical protein n=1 Tax=Streptomyces sp. NBC_01594 TaxID=2975890 RepID=UPI0038707714